MEKKRRDQISSVSAKILIETIGFLAKTFVSLSSLTSHPLFSIIVALYSLILLYFPRIFLDLIFSPVLISTGILLSTLIRLGSIQKIEHEKFLISVPDHVLEFVSYEKPEKETETHTSFDENRFFPEPFVEWNVRAPLDVIYEEYEGQEEDDPNEMRINELASLARYYPESDTGSSSDGDFPVIEGWDSPENMYFSWEEEDREGLIEIQLDGIKRSSGFVQFEEDDNLIEIEISSMGSPANWNVFQRVSDSVNSD
ncbi:hypothetical protein BVC80_155g19 [Macleaya cordata]|uniref:Uncharacterized protein n=1 Tax=Macleaya cordata TaxID=56857 RepID=A0A200RBX5_MACCD|nr:hypothetical protein BVC80_155g19 [Macleaya cordata]